jgi:hypothetical protein
VGWLARAIGDFGSQTGEASQINQDFAAKQQEMKIQAARQKIADLMAPLQVQEVQARLKELQQPKNAGIISTPGGGTAGVTYQDGKFAQQPLTQGSDPNAAKAQILQLKASAPKELQEALQVLSERAERDPDGAVQEALKAVVSAAQRQQVTGRLVKGDPVPDKNSSTGYSRPMYDGQGNFVKMIPNIVLPGMTPKETEGWQVTTDGDGNVIMVPKTTVTRPVGPGARATAGAPQAAPSSGGAAPQNPGVPAGGRVIGHKDTPLDRDAVKASATARDAYAVLQSAEQAAVSKNPRAHLALVFDAVRAMVQGAGRMTTSEIAQEAKAGSYGQQLQRWYTQAESGLLPDEQVQQILQVVRESYEGKRQAAEQSWQYTFPDKPMPPWIKKQEGSSNIPPPPEGYVVQPQQGANP